MIENSLSSVLTVIFKWIDIWMYMRKVHFENLVLVINMKIVVIVYVNWAHLLVVHASGPNSVAIKIPVKVFLVNMKISRLIPFAMCPK